MKRRKDKCFTLSNNSIAQVRLFPCVCVCVLSHRYTLKVFVLLKQADAVGHVKYSVMDPEGLNVEKMKKRKKKRELVKSNVSFTLRHNRGVIIGVKINSASFASSNWCDDTLILQEDELSL